MLYWRPFYFVFHNIFLFLFTLFSCFAGSSDGTSQKCEASPHIDGAHLDLHTLTLNLNHACVRFVCVKNIDLVCVVLRQACKDGCGTTTRCERTHYTMPYGGGDVVLQRTKKKHLGFSFRRVNHSAGRACAQCRVRMGAGRC